MKRRIKGGIEQLRPSGPIRRSTHKARFGWQWLWVCFTAVGLFLSLKFGRLYFPNVASGQAHHNQVTSSHLPQTFDELLTLPAAELEKCDIAQMDLLCAQGLPGAEDLDLINCQAILDEWAAHVRSETERNFHRFQADPADYYHSEGYFRMLMMAVVLYEDQGIRYNPARIVMPDKIDPNDHFFADAHDVFVHGLIGDRRMGTCSSMPVLYIAIGRRLGYPLKLVTTKAHLFVRWEANKDRFDMEATGKGMNRYDDEHFKQWPFPVSDAEIQTEGFFKITDRRRRIGGFPLAPRQLPERSRTLKRSNHKLRESLAIGSRMEYVSCALGRFGSVNIAVTCQWKIC
jgi:hypothetical protein